MTTDIFLRLDRTQSRVIILKKRKKTSSKATCYFQFCQWISTGLTGGKSAAPWDFYSWHDFLHPVGRRGVFDGILGSRPRNKYLALSLAALHRIHIPKDNGRGGKFAFFSGQPGIFCARFDPCRCSCSVQNFKNEAMSCSRFSSKVSPLPRSIKGPVSWASTTWAITGKL